MTVPGPRVKIDHQSQKLFINDEPFPFYMAERGPTIEKHAQREGHEMGVVMVPLLALTITEIGADGQVVSESTCVPRSLKD